MSELRDTSTSAGDAGHEPLPEGEERPPPGTHAAAIVRWSLVALMGLAASGAWIHHVATGGAVDVARTRYRCPMHPTVVQEQKGECPICGMDLVAVADAGAAAAHERKEPPAHEAMEHGETRPAAAAAGPQPLAATPIPMAHGTMPRAEYTCPMHPAFVTDDPKLRCPECGMKLVPKNPDAAPERAAMPADGVPGLTPVELSADRIQLIGMKTAVAMREPLAASIRTVGFVTASEKGLVSVNARFSGWIESLGSGEIGQFVKKGEVLATLYSPEAVGAQQQFLAAARWAEGKPTGPAPSGSPQTEYGRDNRQRLVLLGFAPEDIDAIAAAGAPSQTVNLRAPVSGYVARKAALRGVYVQPGTELFQIADLSVVWVIADVYESEIGRVKVGQKAVLDLPAYPGEKFAGKVTFIYPALAAGSRTLQARIEFRNAGMKLRPGMYGDVTLDLGDQNAIVVPADALVDTGEIQYVFVSKGAGRFEPRRVRAGWSGGGRVAVLEGLAEGERVVTTANFLLDSESRLRAAIEGFGAGSGGR